MVKAADIPQYLLEKSHRVPFRRGGTLSDSEFGAIVFIIDVQLAYHAAVVKFDPYYILLYHLRFQERIRFLAIGDVIPGFIAKTGLGRRRAKLGPHVFLRRLAD